MVLAMTYNVFRRRWTTFSVLEEVIIICFTYCTIISFPIITTYDAWRVVWLVPDSNDCDNIYGSRIYTRADGVNLHHVIGSALQNMHNVASLKLDPPPPLWNVNRLFSKLSAAAFPLIKVSFRQKI